MFVRLIGFAPIHLWPRLMKMTRLAKRKKRRAMRIGLKRVGAR